MNYRLTRRDFIQYNALALGLLGLSPILKGRATIDPKKDWSKVPTDEFDIKAFDSWYKWNRLYNNTNPNIRKPHKSQSQYAFKANFYHDWTPGIGYTVPWGEVMVAAAPGYVLSPITLNTGRARGERVTIVHDGPFKTCYAHLDKVFIKQGEVKRGDPIGNVKEYKDVAKLMITDSGTWADPDNYGINNGYMDYNENLNIMDKVKNRSISEWRGWSEGYKIYLKRVKLVSQLVNRCKVLNPDEFTFRPHPKKCRWTNIEKYRYLETLYTFKPNFFSDLSNDEFQSIKNEFNKTQTLVLTLPFKKGGMKRYN